MATAKELQAQAQAARVAADKALAEAQALADQARAAERADYTVSRDRFSRSHPWLAALTGKAPSPPDRIAAFMRAETDVDGIPARVVELTGEPGDVALCHPAILHAVAPNRGARPRFMRIKQQLMTRAGRRRLAAALP